MAPSYFNLVNSRGEERNGATSNFMQFLQKIRGFRGRHLCIDMSRATRLVSSATLLFKAEVAFLRAKGVRVTAVAPRKERTHQVLTQTGLTELLSLPACKKVDREDTVHWRHASGVWSKAQPANLASLLVPGNSLTGSLLYTGMIESLSNSIEHAYQDHPRRRQFGAMQDGWWGFQQYRDGVLSTCICDLGIGIANALPIKLASEPGLYSKLIALFRRAKGRDIQSILAAVEYGRSSTGVAQRGKGLRDAHRVIDDAGSGELHIISNQGFYYYKRQAGKDAPIVTTRRLPGSIAGTIYLWVFPIQLHPAADDGSDLGEMI